VPPRLVPVWWLVLEREQVQVLVLEREWERVLVLEQELALVTVLAGHNRKSAHSPG
jgi:hypothetical protein